MTSAPHVARASSTSPGGRLVVRNALLLALNPILRALLAIPLAGFVAHQLGVEGYGAFNFALSFAVLFSVVANVGLNEAFLREVAREPAGASGLWSSVMAIKTGLAFGYLALLALVAAGFGYGPSVIWLIALLGVGQASVSLENTSLALFAGRQEMKAVAGFGGVKVLAETAVTVIVLLAGADALGLAGSRAVLAAVWVAATVWAVRRVYGVTFGRRARGGMIALGRPALGFAAIAAIGCINARIGVLLLENARGLEAVAVFSAAMVPVERLYLFIPAIQDAMFPFFSSIAPTDERRFTASLGRAVRYQCLIAVGLGLSVSLVGPWVLRLVFPRGFEPSADVLEILGLAVAIRVLNGLLATAALARGLERTTARVSALQCVVGVLIALLLVGPQGPTGLAWAVTVSEGAALPVLVALLWRRGSLSARQVTRWLVPVAIGLSLFVGFALTPGSRQSLVIPLAFAATYPFLLLVSRALSREDVGYLMAVLGRDRRG